MGISALYIFIPIDLLPMLPFDDLIILFLLLNFFKKDLDLYWDSADGEETGKNFHGKNIVDGVDFTVTEDNEEGE